MEAPDENQIRLKKEIIQAEIIDKNYNFARYFAIIGDECAPGWLHSERKNL